METKALRDLFRSQAADAVAPYLWSDPEVYGYIDRAQRHFCAKVRGIADATTPAITQVDIVTGEMYAALDSRVLQVRSAFNETANTSLSPFNSLERGEQALRQPGAITGYSLSDQDGAIRWNAVPQADETVSLSVYRAPLAPVTGSSDDLEVHADHHEHLLDWVLHLAYLKQDAETYDLRRSTEARERFELYCRQAKEELSRKRHTPRSVRYGGL